jgi:hypothetical protein
MFSSRASGIGIYTWAKTRDEDEGEEETNLASGRDIGAAEETCVQ